MYFSHTFNLAASHHVAPLRWNNSRSIMQYANCTASTLLCEISFYLQRCLISMTVCYSDFSFGVESFESFVKFCQLYFDILSSLY